MTGYIREELLAVHEQLADNGDNLIADGDIGIGDSGTSSVLRADGGKESSVVVKIDSTKAVDPKGAVSDVVHLVANGTDVAVVHGDSTVADKTLEELGEEPTYVESLSGVSGRFTDERAMEVFSVVMPGKLNIDLIALFREAGVDALGLPGADGSLLTGPRKSAVRVVKDGKKKIKRGGHSGKITSVNATLLETLLDGGYTPIVTVPTPADDGVLVSADADCAVAAVAGALDAKLVVLIDVKGVYADPDDESMLIETVDTPEEFSTLELAAEGFMTKKIMVAKEALDGGAAEIVAADANPNGPIVTVLNGGGTHVTFGTLVEAEGAEQ